MRYEMNTWNILLFRVFVFGLCVHGVQLITVNTPAGTFTGLAGQPAKLGGEPTGNVSVFLGIRYAKPPTGDLRFKRPEPAEVMDAAYDATYHRPHCMQSKKANPYINYFNTSEDCLYLNIYMPGTEVPKSRLAVMIWIYGGSFMYGGADIFDARALSGFADVIVVTFNYRTSVFGFLTSGEPATGNYGLWDQTIAIKWVHDNIAAFGGDPERVTLFGESAGAASVIYQAMYQGNSGRFKRIIAQSGSVLAPWAVKREPEVSFKSFAESVGCSEASSSETLGCLRRIPASDLLKNELSVGPVVDGEFITAYLPTASPSDLANAMSSLRNVEFLSGVNSKDGALAFIRWNPVFEKMGENVDSGISRPTFESAFIPNVLKQIALDDHVTKDAAIFVYTDHADADNKITIRSNMVDFLSDLYFFVPAINLASLHGSISKSGTYFYVYDHIPPAIQRPTWLQGANHAMEIPYVFGLPDMMKIAVGIDPSFPIPIPPADSLLSKDVIIMWTNFAKTGDPNTPLLLPAGVTWPTYNTTEGHYLHITAEMTAQSVKSSFAANRISFWNQLVPSLKKCGDQSRYNSPVVSLSPAANLRTSYILLVAYLFNIFMS